jgi:hypothetical protein
VSGSFGISSSPDADRIPNSYRQVGSRASFSELNQAGYATLCQPFLKGRSVNPTVLKATENAPLVSLTPLNPELDCLITLVVDSGYLVLNPNQSIVVPD